MRNIFFRAGAIAGALAVILGAFGAHGLEKLTQDEKILHAFQTATSYQLFHALALLILAFIFEKAPNKLLKWAGNCFITGIVLFSGSIYLLTYLKATDSAGTKWAGPITPLGGLFLIAGWTLLIWSSLIRNKN